MNTLISFIKFRLNPYQEMVVIFTAITVLFFSIFNPDFEKSTIVTMLLPDLFIKLPLWARVFIDLITITFLVRTIFFIYERFDADIKKSIDRDALLVWFFLLPIIYGVLRVVYDYKFDLIYLYLIGLVLCVFFTTRLIKNQKQNQYSFYMLAGSISIAVAIFEGGLAGLIIFAFLSYFYYGSFQLFVININAEE